jgi:hypothetical protein
MHRHTKHCTVKELHLIAWLASHLPRLTDPVETALWEDALGCSMIAARVATVPMPLLSLRRLLCSGLVTSSPHGRVVQTRGTTRYDGSPEPGT